MSGGGFDRVICIDGLAATGKGTLARALQKRLGWNLLDSGALYRSVALLGREAGLQPRDFAGHASLAEGMDLRFEPGEDRLRVILGGADRTAEVRSEAISSLAAIIAPAPQVRAALMQRQHGLAQPPGLIADGRDMGTVVFPQALVKLFLHADPAERERRRALEVRAAGRADTMAAPQAPGEDIGRRMADRDRLDTARQVSKTEAAQDAIVIDTTEMTAGQVLDRAMEVVRRALPDAVTD